MSAWNTTTPGLGLGTVQIGAANGTSNAGGAITFAARDGGGGSNAQAGIYITSDGTYGTRMYFATTNAYVTGSITAMSISETGVVNVTRAALQQGGNQVLHAGNYTSYSPSLTGSGASGSWGISISGNAATASTASNSSLLNGISVTQIFNNMGDSHGTRTSFDASTPSYNFGFRYVQGTTNGPAAGGGNQFYSWYLGLGNDYPATGAGSYGMHVAIPRGASTPYMSVRYNENNGLGSWIKIAAGYADSAGSVSGSNVSGNISGNASNITAYTINQSVGTGNNVQFNYLKLNKFEE
jgi:hypothetical protein